MRTIRIPAFIAEPVVGVITCSSYQALLAVAVAVVGDIEAVTVHMTA